MLYTNPVWIGLGAQTQETSGYEQRSRHDPDGIGRFYFGREIARVMGHEGAGWLERPDREESEMPDEVVAQMELRPTDTVADIGAGTGYFTFRISRRVPQGKVYAVDIQPEMLAIVAERRKQLGLNNVLTVLGTDRDVRLPDDSIDAVLMVDAYHEFAWPREMMASIHRSLRPGGRVILVEYRGEDPAVPIKRLHKMTVAQARRELEAAGFAWKQTKSFLPYQHFIVFVKEKK
ncbi:MAG: methyltransferase domain-containing protein [Acidobacteria bacterium]|nr:methyltransferase domain-containing protein [Acidobacteriota bacterium]MCW5967745.1 methyltransferase domain-containing protein [Blastocatellales bacterium]